MSETIEQATQTNPCCLVIFGGSGDLAQRKLIPALYNLEISGALPNEFAVVGVGRREMTDEAYREFARMGVEKFSRSGIDHDAWARLEEKISYHKGAIDDSDSYRRLADELSEIEMNDGTEGNRIFYLSIPPSTFGSCIDHLDEAGLITPPGEERFTRVIVEKPIGRDLESARALNETLASVLDESQIYRIDHYLGKETVQNLLVMRFGNSIWEPLWNQKYVDHVQITVAEAEGVGTRAASLDLTGQDPGVEDCL